jgi:RNA polymerase sigma-70 factor (ECF subfamily)
VRSDDTDPEALLARARDGDDAALGRLLERYRNYLRFLARSLLGAPLGLHLDASDLVQETYLEAHRDFARFAGASEAELMAWLRRALVRNLADQARRHGAQRRDAARRESLEELLDRSGAALHRALAASRPSPADQAERREEAVRLADAIESLPADYRDVIRLRHFEGLPFEEVARRMGRSAGASRMLWARALERLNEAVEGRP